MVFYDILLTVSVLSAELLDESEFSLVPEKSSEELDNNLMFLK